MQAPDLVYWGKALPGATASPSPRFHLLRHHSLDVAAVGVECLRRMPSLRRLFAQRLGWCDEHVEHWVAFWLALHDLGKFAESFQGQCPDVFFALRGRDPDPAKPYTLRHDSLGMLFWRDVLAPRVIDGSWFDSASEDLADGLDWWARACTGHHGQPPSEGDHWRQHFDPHHDRAAALAFVDAVRERFLDSGLAASVAAQPPSQFLAASAELSWWLAGLAVLADWLGSNTTYFPYQDVAVPLDAYWPQACRQAARALDASGIVPPASAAAMSFTGLFPSLPEPSPLQGWAAQAPLRAGPQIHLLEDVTGAGKTEAALMLTHRLMAGAHADGFYIALPTMATANAMYGRIAEAYARLFADPASLVLTHGQSFLVDEFAATVLPAGADERDARQLDETATARCTAWLADHQKRALLSPAGVGTIDQALLAVLHSRHQSLRLLGLLRKVLVVDEVHACDVYMQGVLEVLLEFHARAGGSVRSKTYAPVLAAGDELAFDLRANPVVTLRNAAGRPVRHDVVMHEKTRLLRARGLKRWSEWNESERPAPAELVRHACTAWLEARAARLGIEVDPASLRVEGYEQHRGKGGGLRFSTVDFSGQLRVADPFALQQALFSGVGHAKAFGCGLLLVQPAVS